MSHMNKKCYESRRILPCRELLSSPQRALCAPKCPLSFHGVHIKLGVRSRAAFAMLYKHRGMNLDAIVARALLRNTSFSR